MAAGGNGAPLVPFADYHLFSMPGKNIVIQNLGGIGNLTFLPASGNLDEILAFDTGPGNMIIDCLVRKFFPGETYDRDGYRARTGRIIPELLETWMSIPYISAPPPKSTGRELFGEEQTLQVIKPWAEYESPENLLCTAVEFTAQSLAENLRKYIWPHGKIEILYLAGGGADNGFLAERIRAAVAPKIANVSGLDETGISTKSRECVAFALLGFACLHNRPGNVPSATGASRAVVLGQIAMP